MLAANLRCVTRYNLKKTFNTRAYASNNAPLHVLEPLPYPKNSLTPYLSEETIEYHYNKHHATYINKLNDLIRGTNLENMSLLDIVKTQKGPIFNNASQAWNHTFYWNSMSPNGGGLPTGKISNLIDSSFGSFDEFKTKFNSEALNHFGSGWIWLISDPSGSLKVISTHDAYNPILDKCYPLITLDVWEHAYYIDYRNVRANFIEAWWKMVNWKFADRNLSKINN